MEAQFQHVKAFTSRNNGIVDKLVNRIIISFGEKHLSLIALWDTGAMSSCISHQAASALGLTPLGFGIIQTPSSRDIVPVYLIDVILPNNVLVKNLRVMGSKIGDQKIKVQEKGDIKELPLGCLLGMDIIRLGDFCISNYQGKTSFSFRIPSLSETDYTKTEAQQPIKAQQTPSRNALCPCGSGKKYKNCCGKNK